MAARRVARTAIDWAAFAERVPPAQKEFLRAFKHKNDTFLNRVHAFPEKMPALDFAYYEKHIAKAGFVSAFQKAYSATEVPYPKDKSNVKSSVEQEKQAAMVKSKELIASLNKEIADMKALLETIDSVPKAEAMTLEMYEKYFPGNRPNPNKPTHWPHIPSQQPENLHYGK